MDDDGRLWAVQNHDASRSIHLGDQTLRVSWQASTGVARGWQQGEVIASVLTLCMCVCLHSKELCAIKNDGDGESGDGTRGHPRLVCSVLLQTPLRKCLCNCWLPCLLGSLGWWLGPTLSGNVFQDALLLLYIHL